MVLNFELCRQYFVKMHDRIVDLTYLSSITLLNVCFFYLLQIYVNAPNDNIFVDSEQK